MSGKLGGRGSWHGYRRLSVVCEGLPPAAVKRHRLIAPNDSFILKEPTACKLAPSGDLMKLVHILLPSPPSSTKTIWGYQKSGLRLCLTCLHFYALLCLPTSKRGLLSSKTKQQKIVQILVFLILLLLFFLFSLFSFFFFYFVSWNFWFSREGCRCREQHRISLNGV